MYCSQTCPHCQRAKARRTPVKQLAVRRTVPQSYIGPTPVGGGDDLIELDRRGGLLPLLGATGQAHAGAPGPASALGDNPPLRRASGAPGAAAP